MESWKAIFLFLSVILDWHSMAEASKLSSNSTWCCNFFLLVLISLDWCLMLLTNWWYSSCFNSSPFFFSWRLSFYSSIFLSISVNSFFFVWKRPKHEFFRFNALLPLGDIAKLYREKFIFILKFYRYLYINVNYNI